MAPTAVSILPWPLMITTGTVGYSATTRSSNCSPSMALP
jgi:hypothetical protein